MTSNKARKLKLICCGAVEGNFKILSEKLNSLNKSKAGPFDLCICAGPFFGADVENAADQAKALLGNIEDQEGCLSFPFPVYFVDVGILPDGIGLSYKSSSYENILSVVDSSSYGKSSSNTEVKNLFRITTLKASDKDDGINEQGYQGNLMGEDLADICALPEGNLVVAHVPLHAQVYRGNVKDQLCHPLQTKSSHNAYVGCDVMVSSEWGQGVTKVFTEADQSKCKSITLNLSYPINELGSYDVAEFAALCKPRYHVTPSMKEVNFLHFAALPYRNVVSAANDQSSDICHIARFITLGKVQLGKKLPKDQKFLHAVNILTLTALDQQSLSEGANGAQSCPYTDESYSMNENGRVNQVQEGNISKRGGLSEAAARSIMQESNMAASTANDFRWSNKKRRRPLDDSPDENNTTLHVSGLYCPGKREILGVDILEELSAFGCKRVHIIPKAGGRGISNYGFLYFDAHEDALKCIKHFTDPSGEFAQVNVKDRVLDLNWSTGNGSRSFDANESIASNKRKRLTESEAIDSKSLYFKPPKSFSDYSDNTESFETLLETIRHAAERALEDAIQPTDQSEGGERITAKDEPALAVQSRKSNKDGQVITLYAFLDFASHAAASMALQLLTGSLDGGSVDINLPLFDDRAKQILAGSFLNWTPSIARPTYKFQPDSRRECWFCLASSTCEKHLIVAVHNSCYLTMPKGPLNEHHVLVVPVEHDSKNNALGALCGDSASEVQDAIEHYRRFTRDVLQKELFVFERAFQTKGGYHSHVQCIPIDTCDARDLYQTLTQMLSKYDVELKEVSSDLGLKAVIQSQGDTDEKPSSQGYFYIELPMPDGGKKRFVYIRDEQDENKRFVPLQLGREVAATCMKMDLEKAEWKACVLSKDKEAELAANLRSSIEKYE